MVRLVREIASTRKKDFKQAVGERVTEKVIREPSHKEGERESGGWVNQILESSMN